MKALRADKITKSYPPALQVLAPLSLEIRQGEFVAIVGKSGSGKSTLLSLLAGLDQPTTGEVWLDDLCLSRMSEDELSAVRRKQVGFVFQAYHLIPSLTALENILLPAELAGVKDAESRAKDLLAQVGLESRMHHRPSELSGGEQQRVSICRSLMNEPEILFADEPTGNLDSENGRVVLDLLVKLRGNRALVLVTHDQELATRADRVIRLHDGKIEE
jgi:putative ABC transport system ATP-binding protein